MPLLRAGQCQRAGSGNAGAQCGPDIQVRLFNQVIQRPIIERSAGIQFAMFPHPLIETVYPCQNSLFKEELDNHSASLYAKQ